jgi:hypothetical protein
LSTMLTALTALLAGLVTAIRILTLLTRCVLTTLLAALALVFLAARMTALLLATLVLLALILVHRSLHGISPAPHCQPANISRVPEVPRMLDLDARSLSERACASSRTKRRAATKSAVKCIMTSRFGVV